MSPKVPFLRWDDPFRALDMLASLWSSTGLPSVSASAAQAVAVPYRTLFATLQQLLVGRQLTVRIGDHDVTLTVTELDSELESSSLTAAPWTSSDKSRQRPGAGVGPMYSCPRFMPPTIARRPSKSAIFR